LPAGASFDQIRQAYKSQMKKYHPDRFPNDPEKRKYAQQVSQQLNEAYAYFEKKYGR
jgi:curved DNA-binding protein CbpA